MKTSNKRTLFKCVFTLLLALGMALVCGPTTGQDEATEEEEMEFLLEDIVVTGSRIARRDFESVSPIVTVDETLFRQSASMAIEMQLNKLPQFTPTVDTPYFGGDIQPTARNTPGEATVALRGLGANRSLVLINGRRTTPVNGGMYVDLNTIPVAAIERVEAISGGASAVYGADAMAGVVNFILREEFVGMEIDVQAGLTEEGDGFDRTLSGIMGTDIADDRGNLSIAFSFNKRDASYQRDRDWYRELWADPSVYGSQFFPRFSGFVNSGANPVSVSALNSVIDGATFTESPPNEVIFVDDYGNAFTGLGGPAGAPGISGADIADGYIVKMLNNGRYSYNNVTNYLFLPMERYNIYARGNYELNDWIGVFAEGTFSKVNTLTIQEPSPIAFFWAANIDPTVNRDVIPPELLTLLDSRPAKDAPFELRALFPMNRDINTDVYYYNMVTGFEGRIPQIDWTWELFVSRGESETTTLGRGYGSLARTRAILTHVGIDSDGDFIPDTSNFGQGASITGNMGPPGWGFGGATATCTSGLNPFEWDSVTDDCWNAVLADLKTKQVMEQVIWEFNAQGPVIDLPAGEIKGAVGYSIRENDWSFLNDPILTEGRSFQDQALGTYPAGNSFGKIEVDEYYGEAIIPLLKDLPGIKRLDLELGARHSDYNTTGASKTYKALFDWRQADWIRLRGGYNRAERSPNMAELFLSPEQTFGAGAQRGDPCALMNKTPWSANPETNPEHWQDVINLCGNQMEATNPDGDFSYYGVDYRDLYDIYVQNNNTFEGADALGINPMALGEGWIGAFPRAWGNPNVRPETADTWTVGVVFDSVFDNPWIADLRIAIDYYSIEVSDAIGLQSGDVVLQQCFDPRFNPTFDPNSPYCAACLRNTVGGVGDFKQTFYNLGEFETSGIDISIFWNRDAGPGRVGVNTRFNYLLDKKSTELVGVNPILDYTGTFGTGQNGLNGNSYEWEALTEVSYTYEDLRVALRWQFVPSIEQEAAATPEGTNRRGAPRYSMFDLQGSYNLSKNVWLRGGVENLLNKEPPRIGVDPTAPDGMYGGGFGFFTGQYYDTIGRRYYLAARISFE